MIRGIHGLFYSSEPAATRAFFRDKVKLPGSDIGQGWWIFDVPEGDLGVHPADHGAQAGEHDVSFYCDDIAGTVRDLQSRGVRFTQPVADHGYGLVTYFQAPGGIKIQLYEPRYTKTKAPQPSKAKPVGRAKQVAKVAKKASASKRR